MEPLKPEARKRLLKHLTEAEIDEYEQILSQMLMDPAQLDPNTATPNPRFTELLNKVLRAKEEP